jgi:hypothetical protein
MYQCRADERPLNDRIDVDLPTEELDRLARVDALLRVVAAHDRSDRRDREAAARRRVDLRRARRRAKW